MHHGERFNSISHLVGTGCASGGSALLVAHASASGDPWKIVGFSIYGAMLVALYLFSTLYHSLRGRAKAVMRKFDHCAIYLLIAGTYTPFSLVSLRGPWGWTLLGTVWGLALLGIAQEIWFAKGARRLSLAIYVLMGWMALAAAWPLWRALTPGGFAWLAAGGVVYTAGIGFYATDHRLRHGHGFWHLCVLAGSGCHYVTVLRYVA
ncbi:hemolysin III [Variovorax sp. TBS-050B]|uniref:PAQR family membrane homeostasis protein TrhA n=1 Tax=Variovorax sp. TBS-050B TaxID=2940551 RepID=UPI0024737B3A|nr:hemolysin III family protein [Variovorax sp. TBS-050B]MDH6590589.1 hemolysin III [Variovorax sp. TBS-050B]